MGNSAGEARAMLGWITAMDRAYLEVRYKASEEEAKKKARQGQKRGGR